MQGSLLAGKYRLISLIGEGGMGAVWRAEHLGLNAPVAVKLLNPMVAASGDGLSRFHREAQAAASLRSPHVVQIFDHGVDPESHQPFIVMELMEGESLANRIAREGRLSPEQTARVLTQIARALSRAHDAGIVHRDLKPDNVFLVRNEDDEIAKVLDFGIAKTHVNQIGKVSATRTGAVMGTPYYMSPEQISGSKGVDFRTDLWALAVIACECLTGKRPFEGDTIGGLALKICAEPMPRPSSLGAVPPGFDAWFERAAARDATGRFQSAREMAEQLRRVCGVASAAPDRPTHAAPEPQPVQSLSTDALVRTARRTGELTVPSPPRTRGWLAVGLPFLVAAAGAGVWGVAVRQSDELVVPSASVIVEAAAKPPVPVPAPLPQPPPIPATPTEKPAAPTVAPSAAPAPPTARPGTRTAPRPAPASAAPAAKPAPAPSAVPTTAPVLAAFPKEARPASKPAAPSRPSGIGTAISDRK